MTFRSHTDSKLIAAGTYPKAKTFNYLNNINMLIKGG